MNRAQRERLKAEGKNPAAPTKEETVSATAKKSVDASACTACKGTGKVLKTELARKSQKTMAVCQACKGSGKKQ